MEGSSVFFVFSIKNSLSFQSIELVLLVETRQK